jgi:hypothetical protein
MVRLVLENLRNKKVLQLKLRSPCFEFGWIPEFRHQQQDTLTYEEDEAQG